MIVSLGEVFDVSVDKTTEELLLAGKLTSNAGRKAACALAGLVPVLGPVVNGGTAASITEVRGWSVANHFDKK